ncbi:YjcZ family sporulation protein [Evansella clarkii]|jgi:uncharacterized protein (TIGR01732 family)|nr:YjcZ family sporulation protein [Evansella clarkii]
MSYYYGHSYGHCYPVTRGTGGFALVLVLFILLVIIGAAVVRF